MIGHRVAQQIYPLYLQSKRISEPLSVLQCNANNDEIVADLEKVRYLLSYLLKSTFNVPLCLEFLNYFFKTTHLRPYLRTV